MEERRERFTTDVSALRLRTGRSRRDGVLRGLGALLMAAGVVTALVAYAGSLAQEDLRDIASSQVLATAMLALAVTGAALYLAAAVTAVLRLSLLRLLYDGREQTDRLTAALADRRP
ncbi:hypothetical protein [Streptomyces sp. HB2AG]|uniref:hypothetical protein n=1 Tax=Streptomyces sp. HB2AG TaxID=2983400 RepID=UPI0022AAC2CE|nr:hypothetical protein [Streptomyces sp. HB2AG]MCZ2528208.1 hypothetical protein [Streptomyces sp. HB2AG]